MKHLKRFNESINLDFIQGTYTINPDGSYDVIGNVILSMRNISQLSQLPIKFNKVSGNFDCSYNMLTSLDGSPKEVSGYFDCSYNSLTNLEGCPKSIRNLNCSYNKLITFVGTPKLLLNNFYCDNNNITDFKGFNCEIISFDCIDNPMYEIYELCPTKKFIDALNEYGVIRGDKVYKDRLEDALYQAEADDDIDISKLKFKNYIIVK
jgi:hypothetical protein